VLGDVMSVRASLTACLVAGVLQGVFAVTGVSRVVMRVVPLSVKLAIVVGMGILVAMIGMVSVKLVVANDKTIVGLGDLGDFNLQVSACAGAASGGSSDNL
jgi:AGZA family xanthine/uracil permease-like MFS transporter